MKDRSESIDVTDRAKLFPTLDELIDGWCARRALRPLRILLPVYPLVSPLTDDIADLHEALRDLENLRDGLSPDERSRVTYARRIAQSILDDR
ncbi:MAG TPA: hypothetical protein VNA04_17045 [Thermoanaerobaculia bacterium]|nr:hypothetical protein [Thermoanaerobaculia bacterium]